MSLALTVRLPKAEYGMSGAAVVMRLISTVLPGAFTVKFTFVAGATTPPLTTRFDAVLKLPVSSPPPDKRTSSVPVSAMVWVPLKVTLPATSNSWALAAKVPVPIVGAGATTFSLLENRT